MANTVRVCGQLGVRGGAIVAAGLLLLSAVVGVTADSPRVADAAAGARPVQIQMKNFAFDPPAIAIKAGQTLTWTNDDVVPHTATADGKTWDSGQMAPGRSYTVTVTKPGTYEYTCSNHPFMRAKVIVTN